MGLYCSLPCDLSLSQGHVTCKQCIEFEASFKEYFHTGCSSGHFGVPVPRKQVCMTLTSGQKIVETEEGRWNSGLEGAFQDSLIFPSFQDFE